MRRMFGICFVVALAVGLCAASVQSAAAAYPDRAIDIIIPYGVGGGSDAVARAVAEGMRQVEKYPMVIQNMPGGGAIKGMLHAAMQPADGYTVLAITTTHLIDAVAPRSKVSLLNDFDPLLRIQWDVSAIIISGKSEFKTLDDLIAYGKKNPKALKFGGVSPQGWSEINTMGFFNLFGVEATFIPFDGASEVKAAIIGGHITGAFDELAETVPNIEAGQLKALAVIANSRHPALPSVPCTKELGIDYDRGIMRAWAIKKGTPPDRQKFLHDWIKRAIETPMYKKFADQNYLNVRPGYLGPEDFRKVWDEEVKFYTGVLKGLGHLK
ncbi:MAG: tripartite tricarboxylate transporter substrate binding protein [Syntrophaceae bacterium]|nr:tripartite tricarboxylate transporter substrate binding protein [Syntrophaceae bacterium]